MKAIRVAKAKLLATLQTNRLNHRKIFEEAIEGYKQAVISELERRLNDAKANKKVSLYFQLTQPVDQTKDYDRAIGMLTMSLDTEIELTEQDFACYVLDDWGWKRQFLTSNAYYSKTAADTVATQGFGTED